MEIIAYDKAKLNNTAVALGKFEGIHKGHMLLINKITNLSYKSVVFTINMPDEKVINLDDERYDIFDKCGVDVVCECPFDERISKLSPEDFIKNILCDRLGASYVVVGSDFKFGYKRTGDTETLKKYADIYGYKVIVFEKLKIDEHIVSSTDIRNMLDKGEVDKVIKYMGRPYLISGEVIYGKRLGRTIGFPTVNLIPDIRKKLPLYGAYETRVFIEGDEKIYQAITNVGDNPTVNENSNDDILSKAVIETHLLDYSGDLYGSKIKVEFLNFLRPEIKFNSLDELKKQLEIDKKRVMN